TGETRREYVPVGSALASMPATVSPADTHILPPPQASRPASSAAEASIHALGEAGRVRGTAGRGFRRHGCRRKAYRDVFTASPGRQFHELSPAPHGSELITPCGS